MKICIYGAGAIGGYLGAKLTEIGADVTLIARGPHYQAIKQDGLRLRKDGKELVVYPKCVDTAEKAGKQVSGSFKNRSRQSIKFVPLIGSPPIPIQVDCPRPTADV